MFAGEINARDSRPVMFEPLESRVLLSAGSTDRTLAVSAVTDEGLDAPPAGYVYAAPAGVEPLAAGSKILNDVPEYFWYRGCGPTAAGMVLGYWDTLAYPSYFTGEASTQTAAVSAGIASAGHDADWVPTPDAPAPHHADDCIADFMGTSRDPLPYGWSNFSKVDDAFNSYSDMAGYVAAYSWNETYGSLTFADLQGEIDAGRPMVFLVDSDGNGGTDHFVPIIGYRSSPTNQYACYTTWASDPGIHWFDWRGMSAGDDWGIYGGTYFDPAHNCIDLAPTYADAWPDTLVWGDSLTYDYSVKNYGTQASGGFWVKFYLSANNYITSATDHYLGSVYVGGAAAGQTVTGSTSLTLPSEGSLPAGFTVSDDVWIGMIVDPDNDVAEGSGLEGNNSNLGEWISQDEVAIDGKPDVVGTSFEVDRAMLNLGATTATFRVRNIGQGAAGGFYVGFYLSQNSVVSASDTYLTQRWVSGLASGSAYTGTITLSPGTADPFDGDGTYTIGMVVDHTDIIEEASEGNNYGQGLGVDEAEVSYGERIFQADFEHGDGAMDIRNTTAWAPVDGLWHRTANRGGDTGHSGTHSLHYGRFDKLGGDWDYDVGDSAGVFLTKRFELPNEPITLTFNYLAAVESNSATDLMAVQVYDYAAGTFTTVLSKADGLDYNTAGAWAQAEADLSAWRGQTVQLRFVFDTINDSKNNTEGWYVDDIALWAATNPVTVEGFRSLNYNSNYYHEASRMDYLGDHDTFVFNEEQTNGTFSITTATAGSGVNGAVAVYDYQTGEMLYMDSGSGTGGEAQVVLANSGHWNSYLVELWDAEEDSTGELDVLVDGTGTSGYGTPALDDDGDATISGYIDVGTDTDYYRLVAPPQASGTLDITLSEVGEGIRTRLQVWRADGDDKPEVILSDDNGPEQYQFVGVGPGDVFYVAVADNDFHGTGNFELTVDFSTSVPATLTTAEGYAYFHHDGFVRNTATWSMYVYPGTDVDGWYFAGDTGWTGAYVLTAHPVSGNVDPVLAVYDADTGEQLGFDDNSGGGSVAQLSLTLDELHRYIVAVADAAATATGTVSITIEAPGSRTPTTIALDPAGDGTYSSSLSPAGDTDFFRFTAPADANGDLVVTLTPAATLDGAIALFDAAGTRLGFADANDAAAAEEISVTGLTPGGTYSLSVLSDDYATTGSYTVDVDFDLIVPDEYPGGGIYMIPDWQGDRTETFYISPAGDWDGWLFSNNQSTSGSVFTATGLGGVKPILGLYDVATGQRLAWDPNPTDSDTATFHLDTSGATRYYLVATSKDGTIGNIELHESMAGVGPVTVPVDGDGQGSVASSLSNPATIRYYQADAPATANGPLTVSMTNVDATLTGWIELWDDTAKTSLGRVVAAAPGADVVINYGNADPTHRYVLAVTSRYYVGGAGAFDVQFDFSTALPATINPATDPDMAWQDPNQFGDQTGLHPVPDGEALIMEIRPETAGTIALTGSSDDFDDIVLGLYDAAGDRVAYDVAMGSTEARISYPITGAGVYYVYMDSFSGSGAGSYALTIDAPDFLTPGPLAIDPATGAGSATGLISPASDHDFYTIEAPLRAKGVTVTMTGDGTLKPQVRLYDQAGDRLAGASAFSGPAEFTYDGVAGGETYVIGAGGNWYTGGSFALDVAFDLYDVPLTAGPIEYYGPANLDGDIDAYAVKLDFADDRDGWTFTSEAPGATTFTAIAEAGINPLLALYDGSGDLVALSDRLGGTSETLSYTLNARELYTIMVQDAERDDYGNVDLDVDAPATTAPTILLDAAGYGTGSEVLGYGTDPTREDADYFQFTAPADAGGSAVMTITPVQAFRLQFQMFDAAGNRVGSLFGSPGDGAAASHTYSGLTPGQTYHVAVIAYRYGDHPAGGNFTIEVDFAMNPRVNSLTADPVPAVIGEDELTLTASGVSDGDGDLDSVSFYLDDGDEAFGPGDTLLGTDDSGAEGWSWTGPAAGVGAAGRLLFHAVATDASGNIGSVSLWTCVTYSGDANCDGKVGIADLSAVADNYGKTEGVTWDMGDFNRDGKVGIADLSAVADNYGLGSGSSTGAGDGGAEPAIPPTDSEGAVSDTHVVTGEATIAAAAPSLANVLPGLPSEPERIVVQTLVGVPADGDGGAATLDVGVDLLAAPALAVL